MGIEDFIVKPTIKWLNREKPRKHSHLSDFERIKFELKPCDVLLVEGRSRVSNVIRMITQSPWTHAALYVGRLHDIDDPDLKKIISHYYTGDPADQLIIESLLGYGTIVSNLDNYQNEHLRICRPARLGMKDSRQAIRYAVSRLGIDYDIRQIIDLARFLLPWTFLPGNWRSSLFKHKPGPSIRTVCSTMIAEAFAFVQFPILPLVKQSADEQMQMFRRNPKLCTPSDFDYSPYFKIIKYPFVDIHYHDDHHLLPWNGSEQLEDEEASIYMEASTQPSTKDVEQAICEAIAISEIAAATSNGKTTQSQTTGQTATSNESAIESAPAVSINPEPIADNAGETRSDKPISSSPLPTSQDNKDNVGVNLSEQSTFQKKPTNEDYNKPQLH
ncbi:MAG: hypothetical protein KUG79_17155 [Pseudomonadales bacterium]|nr:hypothetical protein [Pseudomonadales bacterium]